MNGPSTSGALAPTNGDESEFQQMVEQQPDRGGSLSFDTGLQQAESCDEPID